ncbi:MAG: PqqD family protein [Candidatus Omnitrophica bacterium]|nr:PqqD family protein [Candidatus Omnitrophota bacterium]MDD5081022.1 PqqD family protein [Candidatus Omnitrophota bacterium]MDD5441170.1 PqqD family protein [Candidatus Omnitrophota bacterium]
MVDKNKIYSKNKDIVTREIDDELILMPIYKTNSEINKMYTLNETAAFMWDKIDGKNTVSEIINMLIGRYEGVNEEELSADFQEFIADMKSIKAIV